MAEAILHVLATMSAALAFAVFVGRRLGVTRRVAVLIGVGTSNVRQLGDCGRRACPQGR